MSSNCGSCDCFDKSQCGKKGYTFDIVETDNFVDTMVMNASENDGKCKCGSSCGCTNCSCGCH
uniref:Metallothionein n=1 Tax=Fagopyrum esculentum TaxID=3617 RepID=Q0PW20_FAGES|nr:metallothionein [Fagopyrum esculentum]